MKYLLIICLIMMLSACTMVYIPNSVNVPLLKEKGEYKLEANTGSTSWDLHSTVAPIDRLSLMANFSRVNKNNAHDKLNMSLSEIGVGSFHRFGEKLIIEEFIGFGKGSVDNYDKQEENGETVLKDHVKGIYKKQFLQTNLGYTEQKVEFGLACRFSYIDFVSLERPLSYKHERDNAIFFEPAGVIKFGSEHTKLTAQMEWCRSLTNKVSHYNMMNFSFGLQYSGSFYH